MSMSFPSRALAKLAFAALLIVNVLAASAFSRTPEPNTGHVEQLGDSSAALLLAFGESSSADDDGDVAVCGGSGRDFGSAVGPVFAHGVVAHRIRINRYPVLPQAPPLIT